MNRPSVHTCAAAASARAERARIEVAQCDEAVARLRASLASTERLRAHVDLRTSDGVRRHRELTREVTGLRRELTCVRASLTAALREQKQVWRTMRSYDREIGLKRE